MANFLDEAAGSHATWRDVCNRGPPKVGSDGLLIGHWGNALAAAVQCERAGQDLRFASKPSGQVISYLVKRGFGLYRRAANATHEAAKRDRMRSGCAGQSGRTVNGERRGRGASSQRSLDQGTAHFLDELAYDTKETWRDFCDRVSPKVGASGLLVGPWADALNAAVLCERAGSTWRFQDGPAGQVIDYLQERGFGHLIKAANATEAAAKAGRLPIGNCGSATVQGPSASPYKDQTSCVSGCCPWSLIIGSLQSMLGGGGHHATQAPPTPSSQQYPGRPQPHVPSNGVMSSPGRWSGGPSLTGRHRALLIGVNYFGTRAQLRGCINDVINVRQLLTQTFGWDPSDIRTLTDDNRSAMPTRANIMSALRWLITDIRRGDVLFFHFSGHGAQCEDPHGLEEDGMNETILPVDFQQAGQIIDDEIRTMIVDRLPEGVKLTAVMDCCHSGTGLDLPFLWTSRGWKEETNPCYSVGDVTLFSGCEDGDTSADVSSRYAAPGGAMTTAFCEVLRAHPCPTHEQLISLLHQNLRRNGFRQRPQLTSSQCFNIDRPFLISDILPNSNQTVGRVVRRRFPPKPRLMEGPLADMLGIGAAFAGGYLLGDMLGGAMDGGYFDDVADEGF